MSACSGTRTAGIYAIAGFVMPRERNAPKAERKRLAKAELLLNAAVTVQRWADDLTGKNPTAPFSEWGEDDPFVSLCRRYDLTPADLARVAEGIAEQFEARAERAGYAEAWL